MQTQLYNQKGESVGKITLAEKIFGLKMNRDLLFDVVTSQMSNQRQNLAHAKGRGEVRGGGKKPWRQKGTGRARHGSIRSPIWKGGGVTHGPTKERNFKKKINRSMALKALGIALSSKLAEKHFTALEMIKFETMKTREAVVVVKNIAGIFEGIKSSARMLFITGSPADSKALMRPMNNIKHVDVDEARNINALKVTSYPYVVMTKDAVDALEKRFIVK